jgi:hypothetical protein
MKTRKTSPLAHELGAAVDSITADIRSTATIIELASGQVR